MPGPGRRTPHETIDMNGTRDTSDNTGYKGVWRFFYHPSPPNHLNITFYNILLHEGMASFIFYLGIALAISVGSFSKGSIAMVHGLALFVTTSVFSAFGAGFINPHTTIVKFFMGKLPGEWWHIFIYIIAQFLGSVFSTIVTVLSLPGQDTSGGLGVPIRSAAISPGWALFMEFMGTFLLVLVDVLLTDFVHRANVGKAYLTHLAKKPVGVSSNNVDMMNIQRYNHDVFASNVTAYSNFALAALFALLEYMYLDQTGGCFNTFRWFLPSMWSGVSRDNWWIYIVGPSLGALLAYFVGCLVLILIDYSQKEEMKQIDAKDYISSIKQWYESKKEKTG